MEPAEPGPGLSPTPALTWRRKYDQAAQTGAGHGRMPEVRKAFRSGKMSIAVSHSRGRRGIDAPLITIEVHLSGGLPRLHIVGLPETAVRESRDRVRSALLHNQFQFPTRRITINLAPAELPKEGSRFDLAIALGILAATGQIPAAALCGHEFLGELALTGELRPINGVLPAALATRQRGCRLILPQANTPEAALARGLALSGAEHLLQVCAHLQGRERLPQAPPPPASAAPRYPDLAEVRGQPQARRALEIAAAGGHNLLMLGAPGIGKTMLARRLTGILPPLSEEQARQSAAIASISSGGFDPQTWGRRPFRTPHHTASGVALVGGGSNPRPGEISLAHNGVLFLDELPEFDRRVLEVLREPLESGCIAISRAARQVEFPARFQLVAAMNPCPCGYLGDPQRHCSCTPQQILRYRHRISGPLLDRIDLHLMLSRPAPELFGQADATGERSAAVRDRVRRAFQRQWQRSRCCNATLEDAELERHCRLEPQAARQLHQAARQLRLSARALQHTRRVARTIADLAASDQIRDQHLAEAIFYRSLERSAVDNA